MPRKSKVSRWTWSWAAVVTILVPLSTLVLVLLGYGYTLAVESVFGISAGLVADSLSEYLQLSSHVVIHLFSAVLEGAQRSQTYERLYEDLRWWLVLGSTVWGLFFLAWLPRAWWALRLGAFNAVARRAVSAVRRWEPPCFEPVRKMLVWILACFTKSVQGLANAPRAVRWAFGSLSLIWALPLFSLGLVLLLAMLIGYLFGLLPLVGLGVGHSALLQWVVEPAQCVSVRNRDQRLVDQLPLRSNTDVVSGVHCVCLEKDGKEISRGRLVVATAKAVILFDPLTGRTQRFAIGEMTLRPLDSLD